MASSTISWGIALRNLRLIPRLPSTFVPALVMPVFLTVAFSGALAGITAIPGFPADKPIDWFVPLTTMMGSSFAGIATGIGVARDLESGFYDRLLVSPASRPSLLAGSLLASLVRALLPLTTMLIVAALGGANFHGGLAGVAMLAIGSLSMGVIAGAWGWACRCDSRPSRRLPSCSCRCSSACSCRPRRCRWLC